MKLAGHRRTGGFTLVEILMALAIFGLVMAAIYSCWMLILKASRSGLEAAAQVQRERVAIRTIEEALTVARSFGADVRHYTFLAENGSDASLSFVARLPKSFPRSGKFGDFDVRRVTFSVQSSREGHRQLTLRQTPILMEFDEDEQDHPLVLAKNVKELRFEFWNPDRKEWIEDWRQTNQLPKMVKVTLEMMDPNQRYGSSRREEATRIVALPSIMAPPVWQSPNPPGGSGQPPPGTQPGIVPAPGQIRPR